MKFRKQQAIYLQIGDYICDNILNSIWTSGEKIPSVREMAINVALSNSFGFGGTNGTIVLSKVN